MLQHCKFKIFSNSVNALTDSRNYIRIYLINYTISYWLKKIPEIKSKKGEL